MTSIFPRRELLAFAVHMEIALRAKYPIGGWMGPKPTYYAPAVMQKAAELRRAAFIFQTGAPAPFNHADRENVAAAAAELGSAAMIMADVCGALYGPSFHTLGFHLESFSYENRVRCEAPNGFNHPLAMWSLSDWMTATAGEVGEAANVVKKLNRCRDGLPGNDRTEEELRQDLADELADAFIYLDLTAQAAGINIAKAVREKFDRTSEKIGYVEEMPF